MKNAEIVILKKKMQQKLISKAFVKEKGVPVGYVHLWNYKGKWFERKVKPKTWALRFVATKNKINLRGSGGLPIGSKIRWRIMAIQDAIKIKDGIYLTDMKGIKQLVGVNVRGKLKKSGGRQMAKRTLSQAVYLAERKINNRISRGLSKVYKTKSGTLIRYRNGVKQYYNRKMKKWVTSRFQGKKAPVRKRRRM